MILIKCWPRIAPRPTRPPGPHRPHRHLTSRLRWHRRIGHALVAKPVVIGWVCVATGWPVPLGNATLPPQPPPVWEGIPGFAPFPLAQEWQFAGPPLGLPPELALMGIPIQPIQPPASLEQVPEQVPVSEPGSLALLAAALAAFVALQIRKGRHE